MSGLALETRPAV